MKANPLNQELFDEPYKFEFFQAVRLLTHLYPDLKSIGGEALPNEEIVRFRSKVGFDYPPSEVHELTTTFDENLDRDRLDMTVSFMGMVGVSGVLPTHYSELVLDRIRHRDTAMWSFLDIFTHRCVSLFYRAWSKYRFPVGYENGSDDFTGNLYCFAGLGTDGLRGRMAVRDESMLPYAGLIAQKPHSANALENVVGDYFGTKAKLDQFFGQWIELSDDDATFLGERNCGLGLRSIAGTKIWDLQSKFRLRLGPLRFDQFQSFLPVGTGYKPLESIVRLMVGFEVDLDVQLILAKEQVPSTILTTRAKRRPMLGWTSFLKTDAFTTDDGQLVLDLPA